MVVAVVGFGQAAASGLVAGPLLLVFAIPTFTVTIAGALIRFQPNVDFETLELREAGQNLSVVVAHFRCSLH